MESKFFLRKRVFDILFVGFLFLMILFPDIRTPVMGFAQRLFLQTGLFNANTKKAVTDEVFNYYLPLVDISGSRLVSDTLRGKPLFINVWATWCPPCLAEMPDIERLYQELGEDITFIMISVDRNPQKAKNWTEKKQYSFPIYFVEESLPPSLSYEAIPTTWVIGSKGIIHYRHEGMAQYNTKMFKEFLQSL